MRGRPPTSTSAFGRPPAASPRRSALPPAKMIASISAALGDRRPVRGPADALVAEADGAGLGWIEEVAAVDDERRRHRVADLGRGESRELGPLGDDDGGVGALDGLGDRL